MQIILNLIIYVQNSASIYIAISIYITPRRMRVVLSGLVEYSTGTTACLAVNSSDKQANKQWHGDLCAHRLTLFGSEVLFGFLAQFTLEKKSYIYRVLNTK